MENNARQPVRRQVSLDVYMYNIIPTHMYGYGTEVEFLKQSF